MYTYWNFLAFTSHRSYPGQMSTHLKYQETALIQARQTVTQQKKRKNTNPNEKPQRKITY